MSDLLQGNSPDDGPENHAGLPNCLPGYLIASLQEYFSLKEQEPLPAVLADVLTRFEVAFARNGRTVANEFRDDLVKALPALRTFAFSLTGDVTRADDLVQETFVRAWAKWHLYTQGTNFTAWVFTILRNQFYTDMRKRRREIEDADGVQAGKLTAFADQEDASTLKIVWDRIGRLPSTQRQALLLVGAEGHTYEEAAAKLGCQVGTVKSRVSRARALLVEQLGTQDRRMSA